MMSPRARKMALGIVFAVVLLYFFLRGVDFGALGEAFRTADPLYLLGVVVVTVVTYALRAWRWGFLLAPLARVPFGRLFSATFVGFMSGLAIPRAGEVLRPFLVARRHEIKTSAAFASIILERLVDLITVVILFGLYLYVLPAPAAQTRGPLLGMIKAGGGLAGLGALGILGVLFLFHVYAEGALRILERLLGWLPARLARPVFEALRSFSEGLGVLTAPWPHLGAIFLQSAAVWLSIALVIHWNNRAFGLDLPYHATFLIVGFLTVGVAVPTPGMVGGYHESYLLALTEVFGVDKHTAAAVGIAGHALSNLPVLVFGLWFLGREGLDFGKVAEMTDKEERRSP